MKKIIGWSMLILFFIFIFGAVIWSAGLKPALCIFGFVVCALAFIVVAIELISSDK